MVRPRLPRSEPSHAIVAVALVWGEGTSYHGPGGVWFNRQT